MNLETLQILAQAGGSGSNNWTWVIAIVVVICVLAFFLIIAQFFSLWLQAYMSKAGVSFFDLIGMRLRKVNLRQLVLAKIQLVKAGIHEVNVNDLESHYLAGGRVINIAQSLISANRANIELNWKTATAIDLAGRDVLDAVHTSVNPKVIDVPGDQSGKRSIDAVSKDGIQLKARSRVTVRTNIRQLVGGATEETIIARVGEGIVSAIGSSGTHKDVLENPDKISKAVLSKGLDSGTAYEILSIDIADIDVGVNIGAQLQADQAEADAKRFRAEAEKRRALAVATEAEMTAQVEENRAKVVLAEAEVPLAMAEAFRSGNLGIMDYYKMKNIQADTSMRDSISKPGDKGDGA